MNNLVTNISTGESRIVSFLFIEDMLKHMKCAHFTQQEKEQVRIAYELADRLHSAQWRHDKTLYIYHIDRSIGIYLNETLSEGEDCRSRDLIALILHDCVEDNENGLFEIIKNNFDFKIIVDVLFMSKPTLRVISQVKKIKQTHPEIVLQLQIVGFMQMYDLVLENKPEKFIRNLKADDSLSEEMCMRLLGLWKNTYKQKYLATTDSVHRNKIFAEFIFLSLISSMQPYLFRIKATERRDNMQNIEGLLKPEKVKSAKGTMFTTMEIYVPRAREIGDDKLVNNLIKDRNNERARFVKVKLLEPELI